MMHESRLWVVHLMIKVLRIRLLEVLVVKLRHRVEETVVIVVVLLLLMRWLISLRRRLRRRRQMEAQLLHIFVLLCCVVSPKRKNEATFEMERQRDKKNDITLLFPVFCLFFRESSV